MVHIFCVMELLLNQLEKQVKPLKLLTERIRPLFLKQHSAL